MLDSRSRSVHVSDCFDSDKQNIVHLVAYIYMLTSNEENGENIPLKTSAGFSSP